MNKKGMTAEERRKLEADVMYFYTHGGPIMDESTTGWAECAMTETSVPARKKDNSAKVAPPRPESTNWRQVVRGGLEAEVAYFYTHGGPVMN